MSEPRAKKSSGCLSFIMTVLFLFLCFVVFANSSSNDMEPAEKPKLTSVATAVPTSTPALDDCVAWATHYATRHMPKDMTLNSVDISTSQGETYLAIVCDMKQMWDGDDYITAAAELICDVLPLLRDKHGFDHVSFIFYGPFIDRYGNTVHQLGMRALYSRETMQKVNTEYFGKYTRALPDGVFKAADTHMIHPSYK